MHIWERRYTQIIKNLKSSTASSGNYDSEFAEFTDWLSCECFPFEWRFVHAKQAIEQLKKAHNSYRLLKTIAGFGTQPDRLEAALQLLRAILAKPSDELRWSIQFKELAPVISLGLASENPKIKRVAEECLDLILKLGCSDFLNLGKE